MTSAPPISDDDTGAPEDADDIAPRPRPGYRSAPRDVAWKVGVVAGVVRAAVGAVGFGGTLLWLPITMATPILAGVGCLMMVTGCTSLHRASRTYMPGLTRIAVGVCLAVSLVVVGLTATLGAGAFGPMRNLPTAPRGDHGPPTVTFQPAP